MNASTDATNVFACFEAQARATPDAVAVIDVHGEATYAQIAARATDVALHLRAQGVAGEVPVGVLMERRADLVAVLLGVWQAGGAYVPFDPADPPDRLRRMLASSRCGLVVGDPARVGPLVAACEAAGQPPPRTIDPDAIPRARGATTTFAQGGAGLAYLLFTSGSTGEPKAVEVEHRHVLALLFSARDLLAFTPADRYLAASTIAFDASITELFLPLVTGGSLLLRDRGILRDPRRLAHDVRAHGVTLVQTSPSVWQVILAEVPDFPRLRVAITHAEAVAPPLAQRLAACAGAAWNLYGPTETTVWATGARLRVDDAPGLSSASAPIGRPLAHVTAFVVDEAGAAVPDGATGELWIGGASVARGYRGHEALSRERFVVVQGARAYRTGDVVARDADGTLHYFGRNDDQIKVRGIRIEPGETEAALLCDPRVAHAAATWFATSAGTRAMVAAVVPKPGATVRAQDLHAGLAKRLPAAMIPSRILFVPWLPMTTSGKVDRRAIRQAAEAQAAAAAAVRS